MRTTVPTSTISLLKPLKTEIFPEVDKELARWKEKAQKIPDQDLRNQALASIEAKRFHCQGGSLYAFLAGDKWKEAITFIVAYQTISDYLDNLCDRSTSLDPADFRLLHESLRAATHPEHQGKNYYALREEQQDNGYLSELVQTCQSQLAMLELSPVQPTLDRLVSLYTDLQVHKHVAIAERVPRLKRWYEEENTNSELTWYEFAASAGSTLTVFCLVSYALGGKVDKWEANMISQGYFPYMQGLHILLDYYIDQKEDLEENDLNFCFYYPSEAKMQQQFSMFIRRAADQIDQLSDSAFHQMIRNGLVGLYLADPKVKHLPSQRKMVKSLLKESGKTAQLFYSLIRMYYRLK
ncbi:tetraprenyl-beta-curcumene synthase family protein [Oceanobacillus kapialis]|uniref:Tetraprenyl-beta-curcumene synthase family protein n=1 Tax=Oceanobacillus kapialis TaxID=481353 RepID=A0ABW5Q056_9BACI